MRTHSVAVVAGIGAGVITAGVEVLHVCAPFDGGFSFQRQGLDRGSARYRRAGRDTASVRGQPVQQGCLGPFSTHAALEAVCGSPLLQ